MAGRFLDKMLADDGALNLIGALIDLQNLGIAHHLLNRILAHVAVAAEYLHGIGGDAHAHIGCKQLCHG